MGKTNMPVDCSISSLHSLHSLHGALASRMKDVCFLGWSTGISMYQACFGRLLLCTPIKQTRLQMVFPLPSDFEEYIRNPKCTVRNAGPLSGYGKSRHMRKVLVDAFKSKLVEIDPPEPQQMVESSSSALQPTLASSKKYSQSSVVVPLGPLFSKGRDRSDVLDEMGSGQRARPPSSLTKKQAQRVEEQQPLPAAKDTGTSGVDWAAKYRQAMERQQRAIEILQGVGASEDALVAWPPSAGGKKVCGHCGRPWKGWAQNIMATVGNLGQDNLHWWVVQKRSKITNSFPVLWDCFT
eukprot:scaffold103491_cov14-Tisochrysis_lutea.AAC.1